MSGLKIEDILRKAGLVEWNGAFPEAAPGITQDSRLVEPGWVFAARGGSATSGLRFLSQAIERGASLLVTDHPLPVGLPIPAARVKDLRGALVELSHLIYSSPAKKLRLVGITGTNGKTTTTHLIREVIRTAGEKCALLGTLGYDTGARQREAPLTTPDIDRACALLAESVRAGCGWAVMEVSSHALDQGRVGGLEFAAAGFTNLSRDHLDYHQTMENYAAAKARLFGMVVPEGVGVVNRSDPWSVRMEEKSSAPVVGFATGGDNRDVEGDRRPDLVVRTVEHSLAGGRYRLELPPGSQLLALVGQEGRRGHSFEVRTQLVGEYHGMNIALAAAVTLGLGFPEEAIRAGVEALRAVPGRMEPVRCGQPFFVLVDYSHTPDALERAIRTIRAVGRGRVVVVFGCGGDRDRTKRPIMGAIAAGAADLVVITSDNPRSEDPEAIIAEIAAGIPDELVGKTTRQVDRRKAIAQALALAGPGDTVLIAGKGHETYQEAAGVRRPFDDRKVAAEELVALGYRA